MMQKRKVQCQWPRDLRSRISQMSAVPPEDLTASCFCRALLCVTALGATQARLLRPEGDLEVQARAPAAQSRWEELASRKSGETSGACSKPCTPHTSIQSQSTKRNVPVTRPDGRKRTDCGPDAVHKKAGNWTAYSRKLVTEHVQM